MKRRSFLGLFLTAPALIKAAAVAATPPARTWDASVPRVVVSGDGKIFVRGDMIVDGPILTGKIVR